MPLSTMISPVVNRILSTLFLRYRITLLIAVNAALLFSGCASPRAQLRRTVLHTGYAYVCLDLKAQRIREDDVRKARAKLKRAREHYVKAYKAGLTGLEKRHPGFKAQLEKDPGNAVMVTDRGDVPLLYWTAASLGAAIGLSKDQPGMVIRLPQVGALAHRAKELWPEYKEGAIYELLMIYEAGRPALMGGSIRLAKHYYEEALRYSQGKRASLFVSYGESICVQEQDRETFTFMMNRALDVSQGGVLNSLSRKRARQLLKRIDDLFI